MREVLEAGFIAVQSGGGGFVRVQENGPVSRLPVGVVLAIHYRLDTLPDGLLGIESGIAPPGT